MQKLRQQESQKWSNNLNRVVWMQTLEKVCQLFMFFFLASPAQDS